MIDIVSQLTYITNNTSTTKAIDDVIISRQAVVPLSVQKKKKKKYDEGSYGLTSSYLHSSHFPIHHHPSLTVVGLHSLKTGESSEPRH